MTDIVSSEGDQIAASFINRLKPSLRIEPIVSDDQSSEKGPKSLANLRNLLLWQDVVDSRPVAVLMLRFCQLNEPDFAMREFLQQVPVGFYWILIEHILDSADGSELAADLGGGEVLEGKIGDLQEEPASVLGAASVVVRSCVAEGTQEGVEDVPVCAVELDSVEAGLFGEDEGVLELVLDCLDVLEGGFLGDGVSNSREEGDLLSGEDGGGGDWVESSIQLGVGDSSSVVDLHEHLASLGFDALHHLPPALGLLFVVEAALEGVANASLRNSHAFGEDQACSGSLGVVLSDQIGWDSSFGASNSS